MVIKNNFYSFKDATKAGESIITGNTQGESLTVQVYGDATSFELELFGQVDFQTDTYCSIGGVNVTDYSPIDKITEVGIYMFPIEGIGRFKFSLNSVSGGSVTVFCRTGGGI